MTTQTPIRPWLRFVSVGLFIVLAGHVNAIVRNVSVVTDSGEPVANATVTIVFPSGSEREEETDDRGVLVFNFPDNGNYVIRYPGGEMSYAVTGAGGGISNAVKWVGGLTLATATVLAVTDGNGNSDNPDPTSDTSGVTDPGDPPPSDPPPSDPPPSDPPTSVDGTYNCSFSETSNADGHPTGSLNGDYAVTTSGPSLNVNHASGGTDFMASGTIADNSGSFSGTGAFEAFTGAQVSGSLDFDASGASGILEVVCPGCPDSNSNSMADPVQGNLSCSI